MVASSWAWQVAATAGALAVGAAATVALLPPLQRRLRHPEVAAQIPLSAYLSFDLSIRLHSYLLSKGGVSKNLTKIPDVETLAPGIIRILGKNPSRMTLLGTNTYLLGEGPKRLLIDSSDGNSEYMSNLARVCEAHGVDEITDLVITHGHLDHIGGVLRVRELFPGVKIWKYMPPGGADRKLRYTNSTCENLLIQPLSHHQSFPIPGVNAVLRTEYMPGHCVDHVCFLLEDNSTSKVSLFSGDCILGEGSCVFDSLGELMNSLMRLRALAPTVIYPAHGPVIAKAAEKIEEYISHRQDREREVIEALKSTTRPLSPKELVRLVYGSLPFVLGLAAQKAVVTHLEKLVQEKRVRRTDATSWFSTATYQLV